MKRNINISHLTGGLKNIKKKRFGANEDPFIGPWNESERKCVCGGGTTTGEDVLLWCSSLASHGIEMETVGFLPLLSVVRFLNTHKYTHRETYTVRVFWSNIAYHNKQRHLFQLVLQWWIHRICHEWVDFVVLAAWPVAHLISSILHFGNVMSAGNVSKRYQLLGRKRNKFTD